MTAVQEIHGIFKFADEFFSDEDEKTEYTFPSYTPKVVAPQWYFEEDGELVNSTKYQLDHLFFTGRYQEACDLGEECLRGATNTRRETYEAILICAAKANNKPLGMKMLEHLESLNVEDSGLAYICSKYKSLLQKTP